MVPFDTACTGRTTTSDFDWTEPGLSTAFTSAMAHLEKVRETFLASPDEQLILMPNTASSNLCPGWVLYMERVTEAGKVWLPVQYALVKVPKYMAVWIAPYYNWVISESDVPTPLGLCRGHI